MRVPSFTYNPPELAFTPLRITVPAPFLYKICAPAWSVICELMIRLPCVLFWKIAKLLRLAPVRKPPLIVESCAPALAVNRMPPMESWLTELPVRVKVRAAGVLKRNVVAA